MSSEAGPDAGHEKARELLRETLTHYRELFGESAATYAGAMPVAANDAVQSADEDEELSLSRLLNEKLSIFPDPNARSWYKLFRHIDDDGSGRVSYAELVDLLRSSREDEEELEPEPDPRAAD